jgi:hypothetical protein
MAKKQKHVNDLTDQEVADAHINYGNNREFGGVYEVFRVAARLIEPLEAPVAVPQPAYDFQTADRLISVAARQMAEAAGIRNLLAATVKRYAFADPSTDDDFDPDGTRSAAVAELILQDAAWANAKADG